MANLYRVSHEWAWNNGATKVFQASFGPFQVPPLRWEKMTQRGQGKPPLEPTESTKATVQYIAIPHFSLNKAIQNPYHSLIHQSNLIPLRPHDRHAELESWSNLSICCIVVPPPFQSAKVAKVAKHWMS